MGFCGEHPAETHAPWLQVKPDAQVVHAAPLAPQACVELPALQVLPTQHPLQVWLQPWLGATHWLDSHDWPEGQVVQAWPP